jgi:hypothetical protein
MHEVEEQEILTQALNLNSRAPAVTETSTTTAPTTVETPTPVAK